MEEQISSNQEGKKGSQAKVLTFSLDLEGFDLNFVGERLFSCASVIIPCVFVQSKMSTNRRSSMAQNNLSLCLQNKAQKYVLP